MPQHVVRLLFIACMCMCIQGCKSSSEPDPPRQANTQESSPDEGPSDPPGEDEQEPGIEGIPNEVVTAAKAFLTTLLSLEADLASHGPMAFSDLPTEQLSLILASIFVDAYGELESFGDITLIESYASEYGPLWKLLVKVRQGTGEIEARVDVLKNGDALEVVKFTLEGRSDDEPQNTEEDLRALTAEFMGEFNKGAEAFAASFTGLLHPEMEAIYPLHFESMAPISSFAIVDIDEGELEGARVVRIVAQGAEGEVELIAVFWLMLDRWNLIGLQIDA